MSEYQYYEFAAVDQPLSAQQQAELRQRSSRATISSSHFINEYHWGDLKGDPLDWMQRYFDAHVYSANWGSCRWMLRLPRATLDATTLAPYIAEGTGYSDFEPRLSATESAEHWVLDWSFDDDSGEIERFWTEDGAGWMARLLPLREELLRGDTRALYLGWLARAIAGEFDDADPEPPVPAGLAHLSAAQQALAEFLLIGPDWLQAAATASPALAPLQPQDVDVELWLQTQTEADMRATLRLLLAGQSLQAQGAVRRAYLDWQRLRQPSHRLPAAPQRSLAQLRAGVQQAQQQRQQVEQRAREARAAQLQAEHNALLQRLAQEAPQVWQEIDATVARGTGAAYDDAFKLLQTLAEALHRAGQTADFHQGLAHLQERHGRRPAWVRRLNQASWLRG